MKLEMNKVLIPNVFIRNANPNPTNDPVNNEGANIPPFPPEPRVNEVAITLIRIIVIVTNIRTQGLAVNEANRLLPKSAV